MESESIKNLKTIQSSKFYIKSRNLCVIYDIVGDIPYWIVVII